MFGLGRPRRLDRNAKVRIMGALQRRPARSIGLEEKPEREATAGVDVLRT